MKVEQKVSEIQKTLSNAKGIIGFVPTMGALHEGHASLVRRCRQECDVVVVSIFVNPTQFNDKNDLQNYPRTPENDFKLLENAGADIVFCPSVEEIYPEQDTRKFDFGALEQVMEGEHRPGHFNGVGQVVSRLFDIVKPDRAYFGEKDFQQLAIIHRLVEICGFDIEIVGCPILRAADGLALSSRNALLTVEQRAAVPHIYNVLKRAADVMSKQMNIEELKSWVEAEINKNEQMNVEYFQIANAITLQPVKSWDEAGQKQGCVAVRIGNIRLIDNIKLCR